LRQSGDTLLNHLTVETEIQEEGIMHPPFIDASSTLSTPARQDVTARQRLEGVLEKLPAPGTQRSPEAQDRPINPAELVEPIQRINDVMRQHGLEFDLSDERTRVVTRVVDSQSGEVIRQIPAEEVLRIAERLGEMQGNLLSSQA
jgi:flagellar protein FlaG